MGETAAYYNKAVARSVAEKKIPPTASGKLYPTVALTELFVVEVELDSAPEFVPVPVFAAAGEDVVFAVVPLVV